MRLYIEAIRLGNISLLKSMSKKMMLLAKAHTFKATKSADIFLFSYGCDVLFLQSAQNISSTVSNWPAQSYSAAHYILFIKVLHSILKRISDEEEKLNCFSEIGNKSNLKSTEMKILGW